MDEKKAIFATLRGYGVEYEFELENNAKKGEEKFEEKARGYFGEIASKLGRYEVDKIIVAGPGFAKENLKKFLDGKNPEILKKIIFENCSYAERSGVNEILKSGIVSKVMGESRVENETNMIEKLKAEIGKDSGLAVYGKKETGKAVGYGAVKELFVLDELLRKDGEVEKLLEKAEKGGAGITIFSSESDPGGELKGLSGIAGILRFRIQ